jgi:hypothetical protein
MRRAPHVGVAEQGVGDCRLLGEDIEGGPGHVAEIERRAQRHFVHQGIFAG